MYDLIIIGSGPAGLSAAVYGKRAGLNLLIIEEKPMSGGQILNTYEVDNYLGLPGISGFDMGMTFRQHAEKLGAEFLEATVHSVEERGDYKCVYAGNQELETRTVIFATGAEHAKLGVPGEEELNGMGVSYCATCDGAFFRGRTVAVVGGGDVALEDAIYLARTCEKVYLIHRRDSLRGSHGITGGIKESSQRGDPLRPCGHGDLRGGYGGKAAHQKREDGRREGSGSSGHLYRCRYPSQHRTAAEPGDSR